MELGAPASGGSVGERPKMPEWKPKAKFETKREASLRAARMTPRSATPRMGYELTICAHSASAGAAGFLFCLWNTLWFASLTGTGPTPRLAWGKSRRLLCLCSVEVYSLPSSSLVW